MKRILLTTTSLILAAGVVSAETSITWSGKATAGMARTGKVKAGTAAAFSATTITDAAAADAIIDKAVEDAGAAVAVYTKAGATAARAALTLEEKTLGTSANDVAQAKKIATARAIIDAVAGTAATAAGKMTQYSEINAAVSGSVTTDGGVVISMGASLDAGNGYDFADDDGFDGRTAGSVSLDSLSIDFGAGGKLTLNDNGITHLVDGDDDGAADLLYTNTFGTASVSFAMDIDDGDSDHKNTAAAFASGTAIATSTTHSVESINYASTSDITYTAASKANDVQWSAKVAMPLAGANVYFAADEEGGDAYGVSTTLAGVALSLDSKREAAEKDAGKKRSNTVGASYTAGAMTLGATYNSIKDGDQWGVSAKYAAGAMSLNLSTDEGSDWSASGAYALGSGASVVGGMNYTEDAYLGLSFAF